MFSDVPLALAIGQHRSRSHTFNAHKADIVAPPHEKRCKVFLTSFACLMSCEEGATESHQMFHVNSTNDPSSPNITIPILQGQGRTDCILLLIGRGGTGISRESRNIRGIGTLTDANLGYMAQCLTSINVNLGGL